MADQPILLPAKTAQFSVPVTIEEGEYIIMTAYTHEGLDICSGPSLALQMLINGAFVSVSTVGYGSVEFKKGCQQLTITIPGTFRISRPDLTPWSCEVGITIDRRANIAGETLLIDAQFFTTDYSDMDTFDGGSFVTEDTNRFDASSF